MDRTAHRRVGAAAIAAFVLLLLIGASRGPAQASPATPAATPDPGSQVAPLQSDPYGEPGFGHDRDGDGGGFDGDRGGFGGDEGGEAPPLMPAPNSGSGTNTT
jgi:hypothetical protein